MGWVVNATSRPGRFSTGHTRYPLYRRLVGLQLCSGRVQKISAPPGFDPRTVHSVVSRYTDYVIPTHSDDDDDDDDNNDNNNNI